MPTTTPTIPRLAGLFLTSALVAAVVAGGGANAATKTTRKSATTKKAVTTKPTATTKAAVTTAPATTAAPASTAAPTTTAAPVNFDTSATLRYAFPTYPVLLDPPRIPTNAQNPVLWLAVDRLVHVDEKSNLIPGLAESWSTSADGLTLTFKLRSGVKFHDGNAFNAAAAKANIERGMTLTTSTVRNDLVNVATVEAPNDTTLVLRLKNRDSSLAAAMSLRPGAMVSPASFNASNNGQFPVGAGMYKVVTNETNAWLYFDRNNDYWDKSANPLARIEMVFLADPSARMNALRSKQVDMAFLDPDYVSDVAKVSGMKVVKFFDLRYFGLQINQDNVKPYADARVRQAMNYAINRQAIVDGVLNGNGEPTEQPFPPGYYAHDPSVEGYYKQDLVKAKALMKEAGFENGFSFTLLIGTTPPKPIYEAVQAQLRQINIKMDIEQIVGNDGVLRMWTNRTADALAIPAAGRPDPAIQIRQYNVRGANGNPGQLVSNTLQSLYEKSLQEDDKDARTKLFQQMSNDLVKNPAGIVILLHPMSGYGMANKVMGVKTYLSGEMEFRGVGIVR